jgi:hypothetical protein
VPMVLPFVVKAIEPLKWGRAQYGLLTVSAVLWSKCWLMIKGKFNDNVFLYPDQFYSMHLGPFMGNEMYLVQAAAVLVTVALLYLVCFRPAATLGTPLSAGAGAFRLTSPPTWQSEIAVNRRAVEEDWQLAPDFVAQRESPV